MKRIAIIGLLFAAVLAFSGSAASSASAFLCVKAFTAGTGKYEDPNCLNKVEKGNYIKVENLGKEVAAGVFCAKVSDAGAGKFEDNECTKADKTNEFLRFELLKGWVVNGSMLGKGATVALAATAAVDTSTVLNAPSLGVRITCSGSTLDGKGAFIQGEASGGAESLTFLGCSAIQLPKGCTYSTTTVGTEPVVASVEVGTPPLDRIRFAPKVGKVFTHLEFEGSECAILGEKPLNGQVVADAQSGQNESTLQPLEGLGTTENNSLELANSKAYLVGGKALLKLASGLPWRFSGLGATS